MTTQSRKPEPATTFNESEPVQSEPYGPIALKLGPALRLTESQMLELCALNDALRIELNAKGELELLPPTGMTSGNRNANIVIELGIWARADGRGEVFDSNTGYTLPNGAVRSPNASWILKSRLAQIPDAEKRRFARIVPDFVIELRSESDRLSGLQAKLEEYLANGVRLGWLLTRWTCGGGFTFTGRMRRWKSWRAWKPCPASRSCPALPWTCGPSGSRLFEITDSEPN